MVQRTPIVEIGKTHVYHVIHTDDLNCHTYWNCTLPAYENGSLYVWFRVTCLVNIGWLIRNHARAPIYEIMCMDFHVCLFVTCNSLHLFIFLSMSIYVCIESSATHGIRWNVLFKMICSYLNLKKLIHGYKRVMGWVMAIRNAVIYVGENTLLHATAV